MMCRYDWNLQLNSNKDSNDMRDTILKSFCLVAIYLCQLLEESQVLSSSTTKQIRRTPRRATDDGPYWYPTPEPNNEFYCIDFEVSGRVQGPEIRFKESLKQKCEYLKNVRGYVFDTPKGTVRGHIQSHSVNILMLKHWLRFIGSTTCYVKEAIFTDHLKMPNFTMSDNFYIIE